MSLARHLAAHWIWCAYVNAVDRRVSPCAWRLLVPCIAILNYDRCKTCVCVSWLYVCMSVCADYGVILAEVAHTPHIELPLRQLSSVVLKQYVESHWSHESGKFCEPQVTTEAKRIIKHLLLAILGSEESKIRAAAVSCGAGQMVEWAGQKVALVNMSPYWSM